MDLRFFAGVILSKTEIGKNLSILPAKLNKLLLVNDSDTIERLLEFDKNHIDNLYSFDENTNIFRLEHIDGEYLARATSVLNPLGVKFKANFTEENITEFGISYVGTIKITYPEETFDVKVPGELSYDPACIPGDKMWVDFYQVNKIVVFVVILVKSCLLGASKKFLKRIYIVIKPIIARYYHKEELFRWMYKQVKYACIYKKSPITYAQYLQKTKRGTGNVQNYLANLELLKKGEIQEVLPPPDFFKDLTEDSGLENSSSRFNEHLDGKLISENSFDFYIPTAKEISESLHLCKKKYEKDVAFALKKVGGLMKPKAKLVQTASIDQPFSSQCPIH